MKRHITEKRIHALLLAAVLILGCVSGSISAAADICFTAVNDTVLDLTADTMPAYSGKVLYAPASVFCNTGLGIYSSYNAVSRTLSLFKGDNIVVFELDGSYCRYGGITDYGVCAITRDGRYYVPVGFICERFSLTYSYITGLEYGNLLRIKNSSAVLTDNSFIDAASMIFASRYQEYVKTGEEVLTLPTPAPSASETVPAQKTQETVGASETVGETKTEEKPKQTENTEKSDDTEGTEGKTTEDGEKSEPPQVFLCIDNVDGDTWQLIETLENADMTAAFFVTAEQVKADPALIRRIAGGGHALGVLVSDGSSADETQGLIFEAAHLRTVLVRGGETEGFICWDGAELSEPEKDAEGVLYLAADCTEGKRMIKALIAADAVTGAITETVTPPQYGR